MMEVKVMGEPVKGEEKEKKYGKYDEWEIESAARTLVEAEEIKADAEKMKYVKMCMEKKYGAAKKVIASLDDLKKVAKEKMAMKEDYEEES